MSRVLVTGATGLLGSSLVPALVARGHEVIRLGRGEHEPIRADLTDKLQTWRALDAASPQIIINLAALTNVDECERQPQAAYRANTLSVENVTSWIAARGACHLVQISTDQVYDGPGPHTEENICLTNYYAFSKYAAELVALRVAATVLRTNLFGASRCAGRQSLSDWLVGVMRRGESARVFEDVWFSPLSLETLAAMIILASEYRNGGVFNLGSRQGTSKADFAFALGRALSLPVDHLTRAPSSAISLAARRPGDMRMDVARFESHFNVTLPTLESEITLVRSLYAAHS